MNDNYSTKQTKVDTYNQQVAEMNHQVMMGFKPWSHQTPRVTMSDLLGRAANDNNETKVA
jgi:hypothetical protein